MTLPAEMISAAGVKLETTLARGLEKLFKPSAIAVIGASEIEGTVGRALMKNLIEGGFRGRIFPVNPKYEGEEIGYGPRDLYCRYCGTVKDLPDKEIDLALIVTPRQTIPGVLETLGQKGVPSVVIISAGFTEIGEEGVDLTRQVEEIIDRYKMTVIGPNCLGIANAEPSISMNATFAQSAPPYGRAAIFSQSGALGISMINRTKRMGLGISYFVSLGNELKIGPRQLLRYWYNDPSVNCFLGYMESAKALAEIRDIAAEITKTKPILLIKAGKSSAGARAAQSHTGALAGNDEAVNAMFSQTGIQRMNTLDELFSSAQALEYAKPSVGNRVAILSNAGGYAVIASDLLDPKLGMNRGLVLASFSEETEKQLAQLLPMTASKRNPVDTTATAPIDNIENYKQSLLTIMRDPNVDSCIVATVPLMDIDLIGFSKMLAEVQQQSDKPLVTLISAGETTLLEIREALREADIPPLAIYSSIRAAVTGLGALERQRRWVERPVDQPVYYDDADRDIVSNILVKAESEKRTLLTTEESLNIMKAYGINVPRFVIVKNLEEALNTAKDIGYPLAIKLNSKTLTHKTEVGGVKVDIRNNDEMIQAFGDMMASLKKFGVTSFQAGEGIMVQKFFAFGREIILGATDDPDFGKLLLIGRGGIYAQIDQDLQFRLNPVTHQDVKEMITGIRAYKILKGYRGKAGVDLELLEDTILRISQLVRDFPQIGELDVNPYLALPKTDDRSRSSVAVDSRIILQKSDLSPKEK